MRITRRVAVSVGVAVAACAASGAAWALTRTTDTQTFTLYGAGATFDTTNGVIASGPIAAVGIERIVSDNSTESTQDFIDEFDLPDGTVTLAVHGSTTLSFDERRCAGTMTGTVAWTITGGTGAYARAAGSGTGRFDNRFVVQRGPDGCEHDTAVVSVFVGHERGTASV